MPQLMNKRVLLAALESNYGADAGPTGADAILMRGEPQLNPIEGEVIERVFVRPYFGASDTIRGTSYVTMSFEVEMAGSGVGATPPPWAKLVRACAHSQTVLASPVTGTAVAGTTSTIGLAVGASAVDGFYVGMPVDITAGPNSGSGNVIVNYVGSTRTATVASLYGTAITGASQYYIPANVTFRPVSSLSDANTALTLYWHQDGVLHKAIGARGSVSFSLDANQIPVLRFNFIALHGTIADAALPTAAFADWMTPAIVSTANTKNINIVGNRNVPTRRIALDFGVQATYRNLVNGEYVHITDRRPTGSATFEAALVSVQDIWTQVKAQVPGALAFRHGTANGSSIAFAANKVQPSRASYSGEDNITMVDVEFALLPNAGNDEYVFTSF